MGFIEQLITGGHHIVYTVYTVIVSVNDDSCDDFGSSNRCFETLSSWFLFSDPTFWDRTGAELGSL